jgi:hypothetical protein
MGDVLRAGSVSARSWPGRVTTESTEQAEKRVEGRMALIFPEFVPPAYVTTFGCVRD